ncbi:unnamed protein product [Pseudo-nitzschia multistriata]|uniref:Uncharacterized protein n=1 Tax=Pseudo-nitzschia multistriata TaxID=183589 RepID=A0A448ZKC1_9STRA|nr:unnamed protein product [Pseudo-nitzschia multistriata]
MFRISPKSLTGWLLHVSISGMFSGSFLNGDPYINWYISGAHTQPSRSKMIAFGSIFAKFLCRSLAYSVCRLRHPFFVVARKVRCLSIVVDRVVFGARNAMVSRAEKTNSKDVSLAIMLNTVLLLIVPSWNFQVGDLFFSRRYVL